MPTFTAVADSNGDFIVPFSAAYTSGQKVTVTAEKDAAIKTIELFAPSEPVAPIAEGALVLEGVMYPTISNTKLLITKDFNTVLNTVNFPNPDANALWRRIQSVEVGEGITSMQAVFRNWTNLKNIILPESLLSITESFTFLGCNIEKLVIPAATVNIEDIQLQNGNGDAAIFSNVIELEYYSSKTITSNLFKFVDSTWLSLQRLTLGLNVATLQANAFNRCPNLRLIKCLRTTPPIISSNTFSYGANGTTNPVGLHPDCVIEVPAASLSAYQTATGWSAFASQMVGV